MRVAGDENPWETIMSHDPMIACSVSPPRATHFAFFLAVSVAAVGCGPSVVTSPDASVETDGETAPVCDPACDPNATCLSGDTCQCDPGYVGDGYACEPESSPGCGDGAVDPGEECDDGNVESGDGCSASCVTERCGDGIVNNGEPCDGGSGCTDTCTIDPGPTLSSSAPSDGAVDVRIGEAITLVFSEPVDPDSVDSSTIHIGPVGWMDGVFYDDTSSMAGTWQVDGSDVTFRPSRPYLQEFSTAHHITVTDGVRDLRGNAATGSVVTFTTIQVDPDFRYHIRNAQFPDRLDTFSGSYETHLTTVDSSGSYWNFPTVAGGWLGLRNDYGGDDLYLEGAGGGDPAFLGAYGGFTGQHWQIAPVESRDAEAAAGESPWLCWLQTESHGAGRSLGVMYGDSEGIAIIGMEDVGFRDQAWFLVNAGPRPTR
ncbi:MAG TPA: hypothetical protein DEF51_31940 [Myxococcales bacterium]|nr:hypothetical protein [Myxococcales bacterium]